MFQNFSCARDGPPHVGADVEVLWSDGRRYNGQFRGTNHQVMFTVSVGNKTLNLVFSQYIFMMHC